MRLIPKGFQAWPEHAISMTPAEVVTMYDKGFVGASADPERSEQLWRTVETHGGTRYGSDAASDWDATAAGQLVPTWLHVEKTFPGCWPGSAQTRGDCVSHGTRNAALVTMACEIVAGTPDPQTGKVEGKPDDLPPEGQRDGVLSTEAIYWWRDHGGDGWSCGHAANVVMTESGLWLRKDYSEFGVNLTRYSGSTAGKWGRTNPPAEIKAFGNQHLVRTVTELQSFEEIRDFLANGYGISSCGSEGFSSSRDENGVSKRQGSWAHAMAYIGADDRAETKSKYGGPLVLVLNSWAVWNSGPRQVMGTNAVIPEGAFWARWSDIQNREAIAFSSVNGWPRKQLPDYLAPAI